MICFVTIAVSLISQADWDNGAFSKDTTGNIGDFLSGTLGVLLSFVSFLLMWKTFATQYRQFERQNELQNQASFETTYFNLLLSLDQVRKEAVIKLEEESKCCSIFKWYQLFIMTAYTSKDEMIIGSDDVQSQVEATQGVVAKCYEDFIDDNGYIGFYFRFVYNYFVPNCLTKSLHCYSIMPFQSMEGIKMNGYILRTYWINTKYLRI